MDNHLDVHQYAIPYQRGMLRSVATKNTDLDKMLQNLQQQLGEAAIVTAQGELQFSNSTDENSQSLKILDSVYKQTMEHTSHLAVIKEAFAYATQYVDQNSTQPTLEDLNCMLQDPEEALDPAERVFTTRFEQEINLKQEMAQNERFAENKLDYLAFRTKIFDVLHEDDDAQMPQIDTYYSDYEQDDDMEIAQERVSYKCPLTKQYYEDPMTSQVCGHSFSSAAIREVIKASPNRVIKCPIPACAHHFGLADLKASPEIAKKADRARQQELKASQRDDHLERL